MLPSTSKSAVPLLWRLCGCARRASVVVCRRQTYTPRWSQCRTLLSDAALCNDLWMGRRAVIKQLLPTVNLDEMTAAVYQQFFSKKTGRTGGASAVDLDIVAWSTRPQDREQLDRVLELFYKLRHVPSAVDVIDSSVYAVVRLCLDEQMSLRTHLDDAINNGVLPGYIESVLAIDYWLEADAADEASRFGAHLMLQEMFADPLANLLSLLACCRHIESVFAPTEDEGDGETEGGQKPDDMSAEQMSFEEQEEVVFKFPYLKNPFDDDHFDLVDSEEDYERLIGKTLLWTATAVASGTDDQLLTENCRLLGQALYHPEQIEELLAILNPLTDNNLLLPNVLQLSIATVEKELSDYADEETDLTDDNGIVNRLKVTLRTLRDCESDAKCADDRRTLSEIVMQRLDAELPQLESEFTQKHQAAFTDWNHNRKATLERQLSLREKRIRLDAIQKERRALDDRSLLLRFFPQRVEMERLAAVEEGEEDDELFGGRPRFTPGNLPSDEQYLEQLFERRAPKKTDVYKF